jgi:hypothetical protein
MLPVMSCLLLSCTLIHQLLSLSPQSIMSVCLTHFIKTGASIVLSVGMQSGSQNGEYWCWNVLISVECSSDAECEHSASMTSADEGVKIEGRSTNLLFSELQLVHTLTCCSPPHIKPRTSAWSFSVSECALLFLGGSRASLVVLVYSRVSFYDGVTFSNIWL